MNEQLQAPVGGHFHPVAERFYEGGQFMPEPDSLGGSKRKAAKKAASYHYNAVTVGGCTVFVSECVRFVPSEYEPRWITRNRAVFTAANEADAQAVAASLPPFGRRAE
jgi:hypothetical protein